MIRIPFADHSGNAKAAAASDAPQPCRAIGPMQNEERLRIMEETLARHAEEIHSSALERIGRIESRVHRAVFLLAPETGEPREENVVDFRQGDANSEAHHSLPSKSAQEALLELNATLKVTREHLDALGSSVQRLRAALKARGLD